MSGEKNWPFRPAAFLSSGLPSMERRMGGVSAPWGTGEYVGVPNVGIALLEGVVWPGP